MNLLTVDHITKVYTQRELFHDASFYLQDGEKVGIIGINGTGKSTLLKIMAGLEEPDAGNVVRANHLVIRYLPQMPEFDPQKGALENVLSYAQIGSVHQQEDREEHEKWNLESNAKSMMTRLGIYNFDEPVGHLSGGQRKRLALVAVLLTPCDVLLLDEPLGALDLKLRKEMQQELKKIQQEVGITFIYVTHDQEEALTMSDKIVVMREGEIQQIGSPTDIYNEPVNEFVANFIGESNIIEGMMVDDYKVVFGGRRFDCVDNGFGKNEVVDVVIRPEDLDIVPRGEGKLKGVVKSVLFKGVHYETMVETKVGTEITVKMAVSNDSPVYNEAANEKMSANDFYLDMEDVEELDEATIIARADAQAWNPDEDEFISIKEVDYDIKKENGKYPVTFSTAAGTSVTVNMIVKDENRVTSTENEEEIYAMNFFKKVDEIQEAVALDTDLKTWANASAWSLEDDTAVEITDVKYDFDPETITPGIYDVTFATKGYEYKIDTTDKFEVGDEVGLTFQPEDIHIMSKNNY